MCFRAPKNMSEPTTELNGSLKDRKSVMNSVQGFENLGDKRHPKQNNFPLSFAQLQFIFHSFSLR